MNERFCYVETTYKKYSLSGAHRPDTIGFFGLAFCLYEKDAPIFRGYANDTCILFDGEFLGRYKGRFNH